MYAASTFSEMGFSEMGFSEMVLSNPRCGNLEGAVPPRPTSWNAAKRVWVCAYHVHGCPGLTPRVRPACYHTIPSYLDPPRPRKTH